MKTFNIIMLISLVSIFICACSTDEINKFENKGYIYFNKSQDTTIFTFAYLADDVTEAVTQAQVNLAGPITDYDREVYFKVIDDTGNPATKYELLNPAILKAGTFQTEIAIKVFKTENLSFERDTLTVQLMDSEDFNLGLRDYLTHTFTFYSRYDKPSWWEGNTERTLGEFSETKYQLLIQITGRIDNPMVNDYGYDYLWTWNRFLILKYLEDYENEHGKPLEDEFGNVITFNF